MTEQTDKRRTWIKVCGITREADMTTCLQLGVDAIGLVFAEKSPRAIDLEQARKLRSLVTDQCSVIALFMDPEQLDVERVLDVVKPDMLQFHGQEPAGFCSQFQQLYIKALSYSDSRLDSLVKQHHQADALIIDSHQPGQIGGTGIVFDWASLETPDRSRWIIAGGLTPDNVGKAVQQCKPWGVDVSSGVESSPGVKDADKIQTFVDAVARADRLCDLQREK